MDRRAEGDLLRRAAFVLVALLALASPGARSQTDQPTPATPTTSTGDTKPSGGPMPGSSTEIEFYKWAVTQGGLVLVILVVLWTYRRDMQRISAKDAEKTEILTDLVADSKVAIQAATSQSAATEKSIHRLSRVLEERRLGIGDRV
jgi:hypothetical protein